MDTLVSLYFTNLDIEQLERLQDIREIVTNLQSLNERLEYIQALTFFAVSISLTILLFVFIYRLIIRILF